MKNIFSTADLNIASLLVALNYRLIDLDRSNGKRVRFCFAQEAGLEETVEAFWNDSLQVSPQKLFNAQKNLKARLYA